MNGSIVIMKGEFEFGRHEAGAIANIERRHIVILDKGGLCTGMDIIRLLGSTIAGLLLEACGSF